MSGRFGKVFWKFFMSLENSHKKSVAEKIIQNWNTNSIISA